MFEPLPSRRLWQSIGIDPVPDKIYDRDDVYEICSEPMGVICEDPSIVLNWFKGLALLGDAAERNQGDR